jgi:hypothetical protein
MTTPELPPPNAYFWTPKPGSGLRPELKSWSTNPGPRPEWDIVGYYTPEEVAAAVLAERERCAKVASETVCDTHLPTGIKIYGIRAAAAIRAELSQGAAPPDFDASVEFEVHCNGEFVASASGPHDEALREALHYLSRYEQDGECKLYRVMREHVPHESKLYAAPPDFDALQAKLDAMMMECRPDAMDDDAPLGASNPNPPECDPRV